MPVECGVPSLQDCANPGLTHARCLIDEIHHYCLIMFLWLYNSKNLGRVGVEAIGQSVWGKARGAPGLGLGDRLAHRRCAGPEAQPLARSWRSYWSAHSHKPHPRGLRQPCSVQRPRGNWGTWFCLEGAGEPPQDIPESLLSSLCCCFKPG